MIITKEEGLVSLFIVLLKLISKKPIKVAPSKGKPGINHEESSIEIAQVTFLAEAFASSLINSLRPIKARKPEISAKERGTKPSIAFKHINNY